MNGMLADVARWWQGGDLLMPAMALVAVVLYALLAERTWTLWGPRRQERADELAALLRVRSGDGEAHQRRWAARCVGLAEARNLTRGLVLCRALAASLPLLGLLGTVTGMADAFGALAAGSAAGLAASASAGIGVALGATQYGLALAVPAVIWEWSLSRRAARLAEDGEAARRRQEGACAC